MVTSSATTEAATETAPPPSSFKGLSYRQQQRDNNYCYHHQRGYYSHQVTGMLFFMLETMYALPPPLIWGRYREPHPNNHRLEGNNQHQ